MGAGEAGQADSLPELPPGWAGGPKGGGGAWEGWKLVWGGRAFLSLPVAPRLCPHVSLRNAAVVWIKAALFGGLRKGERED